MSNEELTADAARRVAIAKDVLANLERFNMAPGHYCETIRSRAEEFPVDANDAAAADWMTENCWVCAMGACLISKLRLFDNVKRDNWFKGPNALLGLSGPTVANNLYDTFTYEQLCLIECAFELTATAIFRYDKGYYGEARAFGNAFYNDRHGRLAAIMQNIVDHNGTFEPGDMAWLQRYKQAVQPEPAVS